jgi:hypothetical protein
MRAAPLRSLQHQRNHADQFLRRHRFEDSQSIDSLQKFRDPWIIAVPRDEDEAFAEMRFRLLHREIKHIAGHVRHEQHTKDHIDIHRHDFPQPVGTVGDGRDDEIVRLEKRLQRVGELLIIVEQENAFDVELRGFTCFARGVGAHRAERISALFGVSSNIPVGRATPLAALS